MKRKESKKPHASREMKTISREMKPVSREMKPVSREMKTISREMKPVSREMKIKKSFLKTISCAMKTISREMKPVSREMKPVSREMKIISGEIEYLFLLRMPLKSPRLEKGLVIYSRQVVSPAYNFFSPYCSKKWMSDNVTTCLFYGIKFNNNIIKRLK
jgi:seryl-tRNA synthetase